MGEKKTIRTIEFTWEHTERIDIISDRVICVDTPGRIDEMDAEEPREEAGDDANQRDI